MDHLTQTPSQWLFSTKLLCVLIAVTLLANLKSLPLMWHVRMLATVCKRFSRVHTSTKALGTRSVFLSVITTTRAPLMECDSNGHKGNSSYLTDLDISRSNLCNLLFGRALKMGPGPMSGQYFLALGGVACTFKQEIMPYQRYQVCSRLLSWDEKWLYIVSHFFDQRSHSEQPGSPTANSYATRKAFTKVKEESKEQSKPERSVRRKLLASAISRCVFKKGRITVAPEQVLRSCGLLRELPDDLSHKTTLSSERQEFGDGFLGREQSKWGALEDKPLKSWEKRRLENLSIARLEDGWDKVHALFCSSDEVSMGTCLDVPFW